MPGFKSFLTELRRRRLYKVTAYYIVAAWLVLQVADVVFPGLGIPEEAIRFVLVAAALGFPVALLIGWMFDITPEGIVRTRRLTEEQKASVDLSLRKTDYLVLAVSLAALAVIAYGLVRQLSQPLEPAAPTTDLRDVPPRSIAVLPFVNMSDDAGNEYFSDGISEELLNQLAGVSGLHVAARTSSFYFKNRNENISDIAARLGVRNVLEGSVRKAGNDVRITAQLIDAATGYHLWSKTYKRQLGDVFAIQEEISIAVTDALKVTLLGKEQNRLSQRPTDNLEAYNAYLLGRQRMAKRTTTALEDAVGYFSEAIALDPRYALAYVGLADAYNLLNSWGNLSLDDMLSKALPAVEKALELDDALGEAYASLGALRSRQGDVDGAETAFKRAIELQPNYATAYHWYGVTLKWQRGRTEEALELHKQALELDPLSRIINMAVAEDYLQLGRYEEALKQGKRVIEIDPDFPRAHTIIADLYWEVFGQVAEAVRWLRKSVDVDAGNPAHLQWLGMAYLDLGDFSAGEHWIGKAIELAPGRWASLWGETYLHAYLGRLEEAQAVAADFLALYPDSRLPLKVLRDADMAAKDYQRAVERYAVSYAALLDEPDPVVNNLNYLVAVDLAMLLQQTGRGERADLLLNKARAAIAEIPRFGFSGFGITDVEILALQGQPDEALTVFREAVQAGWRAMWRVKTEHNGNLASLHGLAGYREVIAIIEADMAQQRGQLEAQGSN